MSDQTVRERLEGHRIAVLCEGSAERVIAEILLDQELMPFQVDDVIRDLDTDRTTIPRMRADRFTDVYLGVEYDRPVAVVRILDSINERFTLKRGYREVPILSFYTRPEIERLILINEGKEGEWQNARKKTQHPSDFCRSNLHMGNVKTEEWVRDYWGNDIDFTESCDY